MVTTQIPIENEEIDLFAGQETLIKKLKFVGGAIKLFKADLADLTAYLVFGDFGSDEFGKLTLYKNAPRTNAERIFISIALFAGIIMFSYMITNLGEMIIQMKVIDEEFDDNEKLEQFFDTFKRFNGGQSLKEE